MISPLQSLTKYSAPSQRGETSRSATYDYSGLDDHIKRQDAVSALKGEKFSALYGGDVAGSVAAGQKIRGLVDHLRLTAPDTTERDPHKVAMPHVVVKSESAGSSSGTTGSEFTLSQPGAQPDVAAPGQPPPPQRMPKPKRIPGVLGNGPDARGIA